MRSLATPFRRHRVRIDANELWRYLLLRVPDVFGRAGRLEDSGVFDIVVLRFNQALDDHLLSISRLLAPLPSGQLTILPIALYSSVIAPGHINQPTFTRPFHSPFT
jgi:hypothetical protein